MLPGNKKQINRMSSLKEYMGAKNKVNRMNGRLSYVEV